MSETPRTTKSEAIRILAAYGHAACDRVEQLENELADKEKQLAEARAEIESKNRLVEQMREALKAIDGIGREAGNARREDALRCFAIAAAALAAERGEK